MARIILKSAIFLAILALLLMTHKSAAAEPTATRDPGCKDGRRAIGDLGITKLSFKGTISHDSESGENDWYFQAEPMIREIDGNGPAAGRLEPGDIIVAIDGLPITTRKAGRLFANLPPGAPVELTVRRKGQMVTAALTPRAVCPEDHPMNFALDRATELEAHAIDAMSSYIEQLSKIRDINTDLPEPPEIRALKLVPELGQGPNAWFGMSIECHECRVTAPKKAGAPHWSFDKPPEIDDIVSGGPAERAGLEPGDVLTHIDGMPIESEKGGQRFSSIEPGDTVSWTFRRGDQTKTVTLVASQRPDLGPENEAALEKSRREYAAALDMLYEVREKIDQDVYRSLEQSKAGLARSGRELARTREIGFSLLFSDTVDKGDIEVRGAESVDVRKDEQSGEIIINTRDATIRIRPLPKKK